MAVKLFQYDADSREVMLDREWIALIPEFKELLNRDKGSPGDYRGSKKKKATMEFTYVYFMEDFASPIRDFEPEEKRAEALYYAGLEPEDIDDKIAAAQERYASLQLKASRSLRTLATFWKGLDAMDDFLNNVDFTETDKQGKIKYSPGDFANDVIKADKLYDAIKTFEKRVENDLKQATGIRGQNSILGDEEGQKKEWREDDIRTGSARTAGGALPSGGASMTGDLLQGIRAAEKAALSAKDGSRPTSVKPVFNDDEEEDDQ